MAINNLNPRRTVWFSPHEPSNKHDIWLSKNAHYDENGEPTTDSNAQRDCDYIFKIYDCGKWNPIVGFNTTAAYKINIVPNHEENHVPLFLNQSQSPDELFDAGTMTDVLTNSDYVDWETILGDESFQNAWDITVNNLNVRRAGHEILGGVWADTFDTTAINGFAQCKFKNNSDSNLYVSGDDILEAIGGSTIGIINTDLLYRSFYNSPSIRKGWTESLGGQFAIKPRFELNGSLTPSNRGKFLKLKDSDDQWWGPIDHDYGDDDNCFEWVDLSDWLDDNFELELASTEKLGGIKANTPKATPIGTYEECVLGTLLIGASGYLTEALFVNVDNIVGKIKTTQGLTISQSNEICIDTIGASSNDILYFDGTNIDWRNVKEPSQEILSNILDIILSGISGSTRIIETNHRYIVEDELRKLTFISYRNNKIIVPSFVDFVTDVVAENPAIKFDNTYEFVETYTVNSSTYTGKFSYSDPYYILELKPETKYVVTLNGNKIYVDEVSDKDTLFNVL